MADLGKLVGQEIGVSSWVSVDQPRINLFANATDDHQWIHVDSERAKKESPFGGTIGHGYLSLALVAPALFETVLEPMGAKSVVNYGLDRVRFMAPVRAGKRVRSHVKLVALEAKGKGMLMTTENTVEIEGEAKPAVIAQSLVLLMN
jgi:acyl dehydratase